MELFDYSNIYDFSAKAEDILFSVIAVMGIGAVFVLGFMAVQAVISRICGND